MNIELKSVVEKFSQSPKQISSKYFYDKKGSELFDRICELDEYYLTRTELLILENYIDCITECFDKDALLVEFGSGSSYKTRLLLRNIAHLGGYVPIDISKKHLLEEAAKLKSEFPDLEIIPLVADYTKHLELPQKHSEAEHRVVFFPGSTLGNFTRSESRTFFETIRDEIELGDGFILGIDLVKDKEIIESAYNDKKNITAEFNLNILNHLNGKFQSDFNTENFFHQAVYNTAENRIEMYLVSKINHSVKIGEQEFELKKDEKILTEYSHKYSVEDIEMLVDGLFEVSKVWIDENKYFGVLYLIPI